MNEFLTITFFLLLPFLGLGNNPNLDLRYEQFDTEILLYLRIENPNKEKQKYRAEVDINSKDFSLRQIRNTVSEKLEVDSLSILNINVFTVEYSVLAQTVIKVNLYQNDIIVATDSLTLEFPNSFSNINSEGGPRDVEFDLGGLKIDRTRTPIGRSFFEAFEKEWESPSEIHDYTIEFEELPFRFRTTRLKVYLDGEIVIDTFLRDNEEFLAQLLNFSISTIRSQLYAKEERDDEIGGNWNGI